MQTLIDQAQRYVGGETQHLREQFFAARFSQTLWSVFGYINDFDLLINNQEEQMLMLVNAEQSWQEISGSHGKQQDDFYYKSLIDGVGYLYIGLVVQVNAASDMAVASTLRTKYHIGSNGKNERSAAVRP
jgi:hypothetical protein